VVPKVNLPGNFKMFCPIYRSSLQYILWYKKVLNTDGNCVQVTTVNGNYLEDVVSARRPVATKYCAGCEISKCALIWAINYNKNALYINDYMLLVLYKNIIIGNYFPQIINIYKSA
jgi:hypothetical protein